MITSRTLLWIASVIFVISLLLPTINDGRGIIFAVWGFVSFMMSRVWIVVWLANPLIVASGWLMIRGRSPVTRRLLAIVAMVFAVFAVTIEEQPGTHSGVTLQSGYWFWLTSVILAGVAVMLPSGDAEPADGSNGMPTAPPSPAT